MKDFIQQALRTEAPISQEVLDRYKQSTLGLIRLLNNIKDLGNEADVIKKGIFYGKNFSPDMLPRHRMAHPDSLSRIDECIRDMHGVIGKMTELGELCEQYMKHFNEGAPIDVTNIMEEIADGWWYDAVICDQRGISWEQPQERVIAKLRQRYPDKFTEYDAQNRDLEKERQVLEAQSFMDKLPPGEHTLGTGFVPAAKEGGRTAREKATNQSNTARPGESVQNTVQRVKDLSAEVQALRRFKKYVHLLLDKIGVPELKECQPCRIAGRILHLWSYPPELFEIPSIDPKEYE